MKFGGAKGQYLLGRVLSGPRIQAVGQRGAKDLIRVIRQLIGLTLLIAHSASAGPPGVLDDPHAIGAGNIEIILASVASEQGGEIGVEGPVLDLTLGIVDGFDFLAVGSMGHVANSGQDEPETGLFMTGFKWQPIQGDQWNASLTPAVSFQIRGDDLTAVNLTLQVERNFRRFAFGTDVVYTWVNDDTHTWRAGVYGLFSASDRLQLLGEVWYFNSLEAIDLGLGLGGGTLNQRGEDLAFNLGFDWESPLGVHVLASAGSGLGSWKRERIGWQGYLGLQWVLDGSAP